MVAKEKKNLHTVVSKPIYFDRLFYRGASGMKTKG